MLYVMDFNQTDLTIIVGKEPDQRCFRCSSHLLASYSRVFEVMLSGPLAGAKEIFLPGDDPYVFELFLRCLKSEEVEFDLERDAFLVLNFADKYMAMDVEEKCNRYLRKLISVPTVFRLLNVSKSLNRHYLVFECLKFIIQNARNIFRSKEFLTQANLATVKLIISQNYLAINSEVDVYNAIVDWVNWNSQSERFYPILQVLGTLLPYVRFFVPREEFSKTPCVDDLSTSMKKMSIFEEMSTSGAEDICYSMNRRSGTAYRQMFKLPSNCNYLPLEMQCFRIKERFRAIRHNLYIYGVTVFVQTPLLVPYSCEGTLMIKNLTTRQQHKQNVELQFNTRWDVTLSSSVVFASVGDLCEILLESSVKGSFSYCRRRCELNCALERVVDPDKGTDNQSHFDAIRAMLLDSSF